MRPICIFDVDGVLVDTLSANVDAYQHACRALALPVPDPAAIRRWLGLPAAEMALRLGCPAPRVEEFLQRHARPRYRDAVARLVTAFGGIPRLLEALARGGAHIAAWSTGDAAVQEMVLATAGIRPRIELLHAPGVVVYPKPDPRGLHEIVVQLGGGTPRFLIDDRGEMLAQAAHISARRIFAAYGYGAADTGQADAVIRSPADLLPLVLGGESQR